MSTRRGDYETKHSNRSGLGASEKANAAPGAATARVSGCPVAKVVEPLTQTDYLDGTGLDAQPASFAFVFIHAEQAPIGFFCACHADHFSRLAHLPFEGPRTC